MGMFKDMRDLHKMGKEETKKRGGMFRMAKDGLAEANQTLQQFQATQGLAQTLATDGVEGQATIRSMVATGKEINLQPEISFELTVDVNGFETQVSHAQVVSPAWLGRLQPGATVPCKVDRNDHSKLLLTLA
jgi:hypothetical protein